MATIVTTSIAKTGQTVIDTVTLDGTDDTFTYSSSSSTNALILRNDSGAAITPTITGDEASASYSVSGVGVIDLSTGYTMDEIADGTAVVIKASSISNYLAGTITITNGTGLTAEYLEF